MLHLRVFYVGPTTHQSQPSLGSRVPKGPLDGCENMAFHLNKRQLVICLVTYLREVLYSRHVLFGIFEFGSDPKCGTSNQLIMFNIDNVAGDLTINNVESEVQCFWMEAECEMDLNKKVDRTWMHVSLYLWLLIHILCAQYREAL